MFTYGFFFISEVQEHEHKSPKGDMRVVLRITKALA